MGFLFGRLPPEVDEDPDPEAVALMEILERLRRDCDRAKRAGTYVTVADLRWLLDEVERLEAALDAAEADTLDIIGRVSDAQERLAL